MNDSKAIAIAIPSALLAMVVILTPPYLIAQTRPIQEPVTELQVEPELPQVEPEPAQPVEPELPQVEPVDIDAQTAAAGTVGIVVFVLVMIALFLVGVACYFLPTVLALMRGHANLLPILIINLFFGWSLIGWIIALVWAVKSSETGKAV